MKLKMHYMAFVTMMTLHTGTVLADELTSSARTSVESDASADAVDIDSLPATASGGQADARQAGGNDREKLQAAVRSSLETAGSVLGAGY